MGANAGMAIRGPYHFRPFRRKLHYASAYIADISEPEKRAQNFGTLRRGLWPGIHYRPTGGLVLQPVGTTHLSLQQRYFPY